MLSIKKLPVLSASQVRSKLHFNFRHSLNEKHFYEHCHYNFSNLCRSFTVLHNLTKKSSNPQLRNYNAEYKAAVALLKRSNIAGFTTNFNDKTASRGLHSTSQNNNQENDDKNKKDKKKNEMDDKLPSLLLKAAFWMLTTSILVIASSLLVPGDNNQSEDLC